ncbi:SPOR domain-containing protein [Algibacter sp. L1A34]|uniref:SPOR domain-containing protein n=1 Tax=Algibacter sp. L1A34 TaxID=2686365 RepID=UPI00131BA6B4|nr:hypothetical protein [Algibacter sp. L1A34]
MPHIEEKDLVAMHDQIEHSEKTLNEFKDVFYGERKKTEVLKKQRSIFMGISFLFLLFLLFVIFTNFTNPTSLNNESHLQDKGLKLYESVYVDSLENKLGEFNKINQDFLDPNILQDKVADDVVVYAVQVGAFEERMVSTPSESLINLKEFQENGFYKYAIGQFDNLNEAQRLRKELLKIGFSDAFIASYKNGKRIKIEEVL